MPHQKKILLSDDNEEFCTLLQEFLHEHGDFHVVHVKKGHEVIDAVHRHQPHLLLLDFMLSHKSGLHVLRKLRENGCNLSTILMTTVPSDKVVEEAKELDVEYVFPKPFSMHAMTERIHSILHNSPTAKH